MKNRDQLARYLEIQAEAIERRAPLDRRPMSEKSVHGLRMATRRARAALWVLGHSSMHRRFRSLRGRLAGLGKSLGAVQRFKSDHAMRKLEPAIRSTLRQLREGP